MPTSKFRVLCTEDDLDIRELIALILKGQSCEVISSASGAEALRLAKTQHFDLYLLDNWLPDRSGIDLCRELRSFDAKTPIVFYSGAAYDKKQQALEAGAQTYLIKPADVNELVRTILRLIASSQSSFARSA